MAITINAGSKTRALLLSSATTNTMSIDAGSGSNRLLVVIFCQRANPLRTYSAVTYNSVALTQVATVSQETAESLDLEVSIWYLIAPSTGANDLSVTMSGASTLEAMALVLEGAAQTSPLDQEVPGSGTSDTTMAISITPGSDNEIVIGGIVHETVAALTVGSGETSLWDTDQGAWVTSASYVIQTSKGTQSVDWTAGAADNWAGLAVSFKEAAAGGTTVTPVAAACIASVPAPTVVLGSLSLTPGAAGSIASVTAPAVVLGSLSVTPVAATCVAGVTDPTVQTGGLLVDPGVAACVAGVTAPTVVLGSLSVTPTAATCVARVVNPAVDDGSAPAASSGKPWMRLRLRNKVI